jgi:ATP-dependent DNA helicase RecQ
LSQFQVRLIQQLKAEQHVQLQQPRQLARFLCGLPSPATSRSSLKSNAAFGALAQAAFPVVLDACVSNR